jgi:hypothetical protein
MAMSAILYGSPHSMPTMKCIVETYFYHFYCLNSAIEDKTERMRASTINSEVYFSDSDFYSEASVNKGIARSVTHSGKLVPLPLPNYPRIPLHASKPRMPSLTHSRLCYIDRKTIPQTVLHKICLEGGGGCTKRVQYILQYTRLDNPLIENGNGETVFHLACLKALPGVIDDYMTELRHGKVDACVFPETRYSEYRRSEYIRRGIRQKERHEGELHGNYIYDCACDIVYTGRYYEPNVKTINSRDDVCIYLWPPTAYMNDDTVSTACSVDDAAAGSSEPPMKRIKIDPDEQQVNIKKTALMVACDTSYYNSSTSSITCT